MRAVLERTIDAAKPISGVMDNVTAGIGETRDNLNHQKEQLTELSLAMEQMSASTTEIADNTVSAANDLDSTFSQCEDAQQDIFNTTDKIRALAKEVESASASAEVLTNSARGVGDLMNDIQSIADQTNLLALNAAIESCARRGAWARLLSGCRRSEKSIITHSRLSSRNTRAFVSDACDY